MDSAERARDMVGLDTRMGAVRLHRFGGPDVLTPEAVDRPTPGEGEILIRMAATSVNPIDGRIRSGSLPPIQASSLPFRLGCDAAGHVAAIGPRGSAFRIGDPVYAMPALGRGTYAEYAIVHEDEVAPAPSTLPLADAGAIPLAALTAWQGLMEHGALRPGQRVLIHGAAGGVGHLAVQFAHHAGATVLATASKGHTSLLSELGASTVIDYRTERFEEIVSDVDLVLDLVGGETQERSWSILRRGGRIVSAVQAPDPSSFDTAPDVSGTRFVARPSGRDLAHIATLIDDGVRVVIGARYPLAKVAEAHAAIERGGVAGKILLLVGAET